MTIDEYQKTPEGQKLWDLLHERSVRNSHVADLMFGPAALIIVGLKNDLAESEKELDDSENARIMAEAELSALKSSVNFSRRKELLRLMEMVSSSEDKNNPVPGNDVLPIALELQKRMDEAMGENTNG